MAGGRPVNLAKGTGTVSGRSADSAEQAAGTRVKRDRLPTGRQTISTIDRRQSMRCEECWTVAYCCRTSQTESVRHRPASRRSHGCSSVGASLWAESTFQVENSVEPETRRCGFVPAIVSELPRRDRASREADLTAGACCQAPPPNGVAQGTVPSTAQKAEGAA